MPRAKPKSKSNKRKRSPPSSQCRKPAAQSSRPFTKSEDEMFLSDSNDEQPRKPAAQSSRSIANSDDEMFLSDSNDEQPRKPAAQSSCSIANSDDEMFLSDSDDEQPRKPATQYSRVTANSEYKMFLGDSDDEMPLPPPGAPIVDYFDPSEHEATPPSRAKTCIRKLGKLVRKVRPDPGSDGSSSGPDIIEKKTTAGEKGDPPQDGRDISPPHNPATVQDGRDNSDGPHNGLGNSNSISQPLEAEIPINSPARKKRRPDLLTKTPATPRKSSPRRVLLSPFIEHAPPSRYVYVDDDSSEEGAYAALVRLAAASPAATPTTSVRLATAPPAANLVAVIEISDDDESPTSASSTTTNNGKIITNPVIEISDSESEYAVSDIELTDELIAQLDHVVPRTCSSPIIIISDSDDE